MVIDPERWAEVDTMRFEQLISLNLHEDNRGWFMETWKPEILDHQFVQTNVARSRQGVLRGMHRQRPGQGKFVLCLSGIIYDVVLDVDEHVWRSYTLMPGYGLWVPPQYYHGYQALTDDTIVQYSVTEKYNKAGEEMIAWDNPRYRIPWPIKHPVLSEKDSVNIRGAA